MDEHLKRDLERALTDSDFANVERNPVVRAAVATHNPDALAQALLQYCQLPATIAELLARGVSTLNDWPRVRDELLRNLGEELGTRSDATTHYTILRDGLKKEAGLDAASAVPSVATQTFLDELRTLITDRDQPTAAGTLYALEDSAVPELIVVARLINMYSSERVGGSIISEDDLKQPAPRKGPWTLNRFFAAHVGDFEIGHRDNLADALTLHLQTQAARTGFTSGFSATLEAMEKWWLALAAGRSNVRDIVNASKQSDNPIMGSPE